MRGKQNRSLHRFWKYTGDWWLTGDWLVTEDWCLPEDTKKKKQFLLIKISINLESGKELAKLGLAEVVKILSVCIGSTWLGGIKTFWDIWRLGIILFITLNSRYIFLIFFDFFLWFSVGPGRFDISRPKCLSQNVLNLLVSYIYNGNMWYFATHIQLKMKTSSSLT